MHIGYEWCWSLQVVNLRTLSLSIGVEDDIFHLYKAWLNTFSFVNMCGGWHYWGIFWLNWPGIFYFHLYKSLILVCSDLSIGVENDTIEGHSDWTGKNFFYFHQYKAWILVHSENDTIEGHSDWTDQISFTFIYTSHES